MYSVYTRKINGQLLAYSKYLVTDGKLYTDINKCRYTPPGPPPLVI